jgi:hypothetical protein
MEIAEINIHKLTTKIKDIKYKISTLRNSITSDNEDFVDKKIDDMKLELIKVEKELKILTDDFNKEKKSVNISLTDFTKNFEKFKKDSKKFVGIKKYNEQIEELLKKINKIVS